MPLGVQQPELEVRCFPHHHDLLDRSGIALKVAIGRPYFSLTDKGRTWLVQRWGFARCQLEGEGLVIPRYRPNGEDAPPQVRHDTPRRGQNGGLCKYDSPRGSGGVIDVHPLARKKVLDVQCPLWIPESIKGADALVSKGYAAVGFQGCWGWSLNGYLAPDWALIPLKGREVLVCFDSDICDPAKSGPASPRAALYKFTRLLRARFADVFIAVIPQPGDEKLGIDDHLSELRDDRDDDFNTSYQETTPVNVRVAE